MGGSMDIPADLYPFEHHYLNLDGLKYHYLDEGQGETMVMVHGNPTWSFYYRELVKNFRDRYRIIVPDHIGCGFSDKPGDDRYPYTLQRRVEDLEALLDHLGLHENVTLVLHDWGGMIGMALAHRRPERIKRLVLLNTAAFHLPQTKSFPWQLWLTRTPLGSALVRGMNAFSATATRVCVTRQPLEPRIRKAYTAPYDNWNNRIATLRFVQDIPLRDKDPGYKLVSDVETNLGQFDALPVLICWGLKDFVFDKHFLATWEKRLPSAQIHRFADCGHYILEDARDEVIALMEEFLAANPLDDQANKEAAA